MKYAGIGRDEAREIGRRAEVALQRALAEDGLEVRYVGGTFDAFDGRMVARFAISLSEIGGRSAEQVRFEKNAPLFSVPPSAYKAEVRFGGRTYEVIGFLPNSRRFPVLARSGGKNYKLPLDALRPLVEEPRVSARAR